jgi:branched-chain amino acid transport system substrate-binding protein
MGYGMTASADGRWFPWVFNFPTTYWSQASAVVRYIAAQEGGFEKLKGKTVAHVFHNSPYGKEANPTLEALAEKYGYKLEQLAVDHPGQEQKSTWLRIRQVKPDWVYVSGWGVMNQVAVKEAASIGFKMDRMIGNWWTGTEADVVPAGAGATGYKSANFTGVGTDFPVIKDIFKYVHDKGKGAGPRDGVGEVLYNRMVVNVMFNIEAIRNAQKKFNTKTPTGEQVRWGYENFNLTAARVKEIGFEGMVRPIKVSCEDHEGNGPVYIQQWDGKSWKRVSDWIEPIREVVRPNLEAAAVTEAGKLGYTKRDCSKEG